MLNEVVCKQLSSRSYITAINNTMDLRTTDDDDDLNVIENKPKKRSAKAESSQSE